jgi:hypothetical protein
MIINFKRSLSNEPPKERNKPQNLHDFLDNDLKQICSKFQTIKAKIHKIQEKNDFMTRYKNKRNIKNRKKIKIFLAYRLASRKKLFNIINRIIKLFSKSTQNFLKIKRLANECEKEVFLISKRNIFAYKCKLNCIYEFLIDKKRSQKIVFKMLNKDLTPFQFIRIKNKHTRTRNKKKPKYTEKITNLNLENLVLLKKFQPISPAPLSPVNSYDVLLNFFNTILEESHLYKENVERQILKYKLRKMEAVYSLSDDERLKIRDLFLEKFPDLVFYVLVGTEKLFV